MFNNINDFGNNIIKHSLKDNKSIYHKDFNNSRKRNMLIDNQEIINNYIEEKTINDISQHTIIQDKMVLHTFCGYVQKPFKEITKQDIIKFFNAMKHGEIQGKRGVYNSSTIEIFKIKLKSFFKWFTSEDEPKQTSMLKYNLNKIQKKNKKTVKDILTAEEIWRFVDSIKTPRNRAIIAVLFDSACRVDEFYKLKIGDIIREETDVSITVNGKTGKRTIPLNKSIKYLDEYLSQHPFKNKDDAPLWLNNRTPPQQICYGGIQQLIINLGKKSSVINKNLHPHLLRHSRLTDLTKKGINEFTLRKIAGWSDDSKMASVYVHLAGVDTKEALRRIEPKKTFVDSDNIENEVQKRVQERMIELEQRLTHKLLDAFEKLNPQQQNAFRPTMTPQELVRTQLQS